jgi:hypothetical protein
MLVRKWARNMETNAFQSDVLALETHSGRVWSLILLMALIGPLLMVALAPSRGIPWPFILAGLLGIGASAMAWSGFQYRFLRDAVEIRMLGFRLQSIPRQAIVSYSIEPWAFRRGYGIRGLGRIRAYVWCNKVVHIRTSNGEVFLAHSDPERIMRDLDLVTGVVTRG